MHLHTSTKWLKIASYTLIGFGLLSALSAHPSLTILSRWFISLAIWPFGDIVSLIDIETRLLWAILGGISVGWGVMFLLLTNQMYEQHHKVLRPIMVKAVISWFIIDSAASIASGAAFNAVLNLGFFALFIIPLWREIETDGTHILETKTS